MIHSVLPSCQPDYILYQFMEVFGSLISTLLYHLFKQEIIGNEKIQFAMEEFSSKLLSKKHFLEALIRTMDNHNNIGAMDR